jgi:hypothetical protein
MDKIEELKKYVKEVVELKTNEKAFEYKRKVITEIAKLIEITHHELECNCLSITIDKMLFDSFYITKNGSFRFHGDFTYNLKGEFYNTVLEHISFDDIIELMNNAIRYAIHYKKINKYWELDEYAHRVMTHATTEELNKINDKIQ